MTRSSSMWVLIGFALAVTTPVDDVTHLVAKLHKVEEIPNSPVSAEAKALRLEAEHALENKTHPEELEKALKDAKDFVASLMNRQTGSLRGKESEELERMMASAKRLEAHLEGVPEGAEARKELEAAVEAKDVVRLHTALESAMTVLKDYLTTLTDEQKKLTASLMSDKTHDLLRQLKLRRSINFGNQLAVLKRPEFQGMPILKKLNTTAGAPALYDQLQGLVSEHVEDEVHHDKGANSESRRVYVVSSKMKNMVKTMTGQLEGMRQQLLKASVNRTDTESKEGAQIAASLGAVLEKVKATNDLQKQLKMLEDFQTTLAMTAK